MVLVIGNGFLGRKIASVFRENDIEVKTADLPNTSSDFVVDISDSEQVSSLLNKLNPETIILTAGLTNVDFCEENPAECSKINVSGTENIVNACKEIDSKLVFISSDFVFDGSKENGNYSEQDETNPINEYGKSKLEGEKLVSSLEDYLILRISTLYGYNGSSDKNTFVNWIVNSLKERKQIKLVEDQITCPTLIDDIASALLILLKNNKTGLFHCTGSEPISRLDFGLKTAEVFNLDKSLISTAKSAELNQKAIRPKNSSLDINRLESLNIKMSSCFQGLQKMKKLM